MPDQATGEVEALRRVLESRISDVFTALPGVVESYDASKMTATIRPGVRRPMPTFDDPDAVAYEDIPSIPNVPICFMRGGGCSITFPLQVGDSVLLVFSSLSPQGWRDGNGETADAGDTRHNHPGNAFAVPCIAPDKQTLAHAVDNGLTLEAATIKIGAGAVDPIARAPAVVSDLAIIAADLLTIGTALDTLGNPVTLNYTAPDSDITAGKGFVE